MAGNTDDRLYLHGYDRNAFRSITVDGHRPCSIHAGITVGEDGASHQTFEDIALMRTIPGMTVVNPSDAASTKILMRQVVEMEGPCYVRLGRASVPVFYDDYANITLGKGNVLRQGKDITVIATGIMRRI